MRSEMRRLKIYNSAQLVFLYDEKHLPLLRGNAPLVEGDVPDEAVQAHGGALAVYDLLEDNELDIGVCVGPPLTEEELGAGPWLGVQRTRLNLSSGKLVIESVDAARFLEEAPQDEGATVEVPPGEYVLTLHRVDLESAWEQAEAEEREPSGPWEVVVLTPLDQVKDPPPLAGVLQAEDLFEDEEAPAEAGELSRGPDRSMEERLASDNVSTLVMALQKLESRPDEARAMLDRLEALVDHENGNVGFLALKLICAVDSPRGGALAMKDLDHPMPQVRDAVAQLCYGVLRSPEARPIIAHLSADKEESVRHAAAHGLRDLDDLSLEDLSPFFEDSADIRLTALVAAMKGGVPLTREQLLAIQGDLGDILLEIKVEEALESLEE